VVKFSQSTSGGYPQPLIFTRRTASSVKFSAVDGVTADVVVGVKEDKETAEEELASPSVSCRNVEFLA